MIKAEWTNKDSLDLQPTCNQLATMDGDLISRADAIEVLMETIAPPSVTLDTLVMRIDALPSAEAVPQSEQYKKGFEDAKRAFLVEYARESENMRKRNAQLEVMLNAQKAISDEAVQGEWTYLSGSKGSYMTISCPICGSTFNGVEEWVYHYCPNCGERMHKGGAE